MVRKSGIGHRRAAARLVAGVLLFVPGTLFSQVQIQISGRSLAVGETLTYEIQIDYEDADDVVVPDVEFPGFRRVEGPSIRPVTRASPNQRSRVVEVRLGFVAEQAGRYVLDPIPIEVAGQLYRTPAALVEVGERGARDRVPFLARWVVPDDPVFVGEASAVTLEIYNADEFVYPTGISVQPPDQAIFEEVQGLGSIGQTVIDGVTLYEIPVAVFMVTPSEAGSIRIDPATVEWEGLTATAAPASIRANEIPEGIAATGAVGSFSLSASLDQTTLAATESSHLTLRLDGVGNLHFLQLPELRLHGLRVDTEVRNEQLIPTETGYSGFIEVVYTLRPVETGRATIAVEPFAYFDRARNRVTRTTIPEFQVNVTAVKRPDPGEGPEVTLKLLRADEIASVEPGNWYRNPLSYGVFAPGLIFLIAFRLWRRRGAGVTLVALAAVLLVASGDWLPWDDINRGLSRYDAGDLAGATHAFEAASRAAPDSPGIQNNLAVLYFQRGDIGRSVYAAREAVRLNPSARPIRDTQVLIERAAGLDRTVPAPHLVHPDVTFVVLAVVVNIFFVLLAFAGKTRRLGRAGLLAIGQILIGVAAVSLAIGLVVAARTHDEQVGVILHDLSLRRIPSETAESWLSLNEGTAVDVVSRKDGFVLVRTELGLEGWVAIDAVLWPQNPAISVLRYRSFVL